MAKQLLTLTDAAAERVRQLLAQRPDPHAALRIGVKTGGCSGLEYTMDFVPEKKKFDEVVEDKGVTVLIDSDAVMFLIGTEMDFKTDVLKSGFVFSNPNETARCGCGESVQIQPAPNAQDATAKA
jgi:iron-sulfur cluster assembly protein